MALAGQRARGTQGLLALVSGGRHQFPATATAPDTFVSFVPFVFKALVTRVGASEAIRGD